MLRSEHGSWLGITLQGRFAVLTNYAESSSKVATAAAHSRGALLKDFLTQSADASETTQEFVDRFLAAEEKHLLDTVGGFYLLCGIIRPSTEQGQTNGVASMAVLSNRSKSGSGHPDPKWLTLRGNETFGLSNCADDDPWPKVELGEKLFARAIEQAVAKHSTKDQLIHSLLEVLSHDTFPDISGIHSLKEYIHSLRYSIFIPATDTEALSSAASKPAAETIDPPGKIHKLWEPTDNHQHSSEGIDGTVSTGAYGTQKQTIVLVDRKGQVTYIEKTLYDEEGRKLDGGCDTGMRMFEFEIEGWPREDEISKEHLWEKGSL